MTKNLKSEFDDLVSDILENEYFLETKKDLHHGTSKYEHSLRVAKLSYRLSKFFKADVRATARAGLLHDFFFGTRKEKPENSYLRHPVTASENAKKYFDISEVEAEAIKTHMFHHVLLQKVLPFVNRKEKVSVKEFKPKTKEGWIICASDLLVSVVECERFQFTYVANVTLLLLFNIIMLKN
ncbi:MAG: HD domain-containing protein [Bacilli bacterium]|nr:HD domain-containing protein [Bacilli bacterium]